MKIVIILFFLIAVAKTEDQAEPEGCEVCRLGIILMFSDFLTPTQISNEEMYLNNLACPQMPEPAGCTVAVLTWWRQIAPLIFSEDATKKICNSLNSDCSITRNWDCDTCMADISAFNNVMTNETTSKAYVDLLTGPAFCQDIRFSQEEQRICQYYISAFIPIALNSLFTNFPPDLICAEYFDLCRTTTKYSVQNQFWLNSLV